MYTTLVLCLAVLGSSIAAPGYVAKTVVLDKEADIPNTVGGSLGASASFGPFSAGAGLGGSADGGGLYAGAKAPQGTAQAGLGGGSSSSASASASASAGGGATAGSGATAGAGTGAAHGTGFFDRIFNIPISILQSVNSHLNANGGVRKRVYVAGGANGVPVASGPAHAGASASAGASAGGADGTARADAGSDASAVASAGGHASVGVRKNYDAVFNIPITALKSVNQFLNGK
ncbi:unnamed protein product [Nezara viridula]|uniref:Neuropeptide n=1 Tax=Nezara viridula TaxID=85310 RepID=A0A9P0E1Y1_NEZVI|nr:unnamed protein product [Nezara viridula]